MSHLVLPPFLKKFLQIDLSFLKPFNPKEGVCKMGNTVQPHILPFLFWLPWGNSSEEAVTSCGGYGNRKIDIRSQSHKLNETIVFIASHPHP